MGGTLARHMPVSWEIALADSVIESLSGSIEGTDNALSSTTAPDPATQAVGSELQALADRLSARMSLPEDLRVTVHYIDDEQVNAFATLGGHVFVNRGLLERLPNENALAMVMAHEIAHAANRDPAAALGGGVLLQLALAVVLGSTPDSLEDLLFGPNALLLLAFSREAEHRADDDGLAAVAALYGHVADAGWLFETILEELAVSDTGEPPALLNTHPLSRDRIMALDGLAESRGWALEGPITPLTPAIASLGAVR
jgi:predicted Zn-dependent protease